MAQKQTENDYGFAKGFLKKASKSLYETIENKSKSEVKIKELLEILKKTEPENLKKIVDQNNINWTNDDKFLHDFNDDCDDDDF